MESWEYAPGKYEILKERFSLTWKDIIQADLHEREPWKKYRKVMLWNRTFIQGARRFKAEVLFGLMETSELLDVNNIDYEIEDQETIEIND